MESPHIYQEGHLKTQPENSFAQTISKYFIPDHGSVPELTLAPASPHSRSDEEDIEETQEQMAENIRKREADALEREENVRKSNEEYNISYKRKEKD